MKGYCELVPYDIGRKIRCFLGNLISVRMHWHDDYELIYCLSGTYTIEYEEATEVMVPGEFRLIGPRQSHAVRSSGEGAAQITLFFHRNTMMLPYDKRISFGTIGCVDKYGELTERLQRELFTLCEEIQDCKRTVGWEHERHYYRAWSAFYAIAAELTAFITDRSPEEMDADRQDSLIEQVIEIIQNEFADPLTAADLARRMHVSESVLSRHMRERVGYTFTEYLTYVRLNAVQEKLLYTSDAIVDIMYSCGFSSPSNFYRVFRKHNGMSPQEYRNRGEENRIGNIRRTALAQNIWQKFSL